ncbi:MAG: kynureninase [Phycisphaerales bacterium]|nr:kynureninase [Phycisphaerales bacterium]
MPTPSVNAAEAAALALDQADPLRAFREQFHIPRTPDGSAEVVYLCGNSLGLMPRATRDAVMQELDDWARLGVEGHFHARHPWFPAHEFCRETAARLVGARPHEVVMMNSLTVNLHLMMATFYRPTPDRYRIVIEDAAFPSDSYAVWSQAHWHGLDPSDAVVRLKPRHGEHALRTDDILETLERHGETIALVMLSGVNYLTGQVFDFAKITEAGHRLGAHVGWDLAHAAGNIPLSLHDWNADFACWCSYKYLNSGAGAVAGCFIHERHTRNTDLPRFAGWWGNDPKTRFKMGPEFVPIPTADAWSLSNPPVLALSPVRVSLGIFDLATMPALRTKSLALHAYLRTQVESLRSPAIDLITPREDSAHGSQLSIAVKDRPRDLFNALTQDHVMCDFREPNVVRIAPVPLYNTFHDCWRFTEILRKHLMP